MWSTSTVEEGLQQEQISAWVQQYRREYAGLIDRTASIAARKYTPLSEDLWQVMEPLIEPNQQTSLIIGHPGTGLSDILPSLIQRLSVENSTDAHWMFWDVTPMNLYTVCNLLCPSNWETMQSGTFPDDNAHQKTKSTISRHNLNH